MDSETELGVNVMGGKINSTISGRHNVWIDIMWVTAEQPRSNAAKQFVNCLYKMKR